MVPSKYRTDQKKTASFKEWLALTSYAPCKNTNKGYVSSSIFGKPRFQINKSVVTL
jgi:hypothetical protein